MVRRDCKPLDHNSAGNTPVIVVTVANVKLKNYIDVAFRLVAILI
jgi:hypothetical protein